MRQNRLGGLTSRGGPEQKKTQKVLDFHRNDVSPLTQDLRYRAACDHELRGSASPVLTATHNNNNNKRICIAQVCRMTSEALGGQLQSSYTARGGPKSLTEEKCFKTTLEQS